MQSVFVILGATAVGKTDLSLDLAELIDGEIINVAPGPIVTMYELQPAPGIKASKIITLSDDIARNTSSDLSCIPI